MNQPPRSIKQAERIAVVLPSLEGGGAERSMLNLAGGFVAAGRQVDLVLCQAKGAYMDQIPAGVSMTELRRAPELLGRLQAAIDLRGQFRSVLLPVLLAKKNAPEVACLRSLRDYFDSHRPDVVISALTYANLVALWASRLSASRPPVLVSERNALATLCAMPIKHRKWRWRYLPRVVAETYPEARAVITVSRHVARELQHPVGLAADSLTTIHNPVVDERIDSAAREALSHPWFAPGEPPVVLGVGRLAPQKDFATLLRAFALVRRQRPTRLVILGEGELRSSLEAQAAELGIAGDIDLIGFVDNPFQYMARSGVLVLSSEYEGLPGALIQAMACGCPVVSSDCPGGSAEILGEGVYGELVGVGDDAAMAAAIARQLDQPTPRDRLLRRAADFSVDRAVTRYLDLADAVFNEALSGG